MAYETGTATDHVDLFNKIRDFLTTNATLVSASQNWSQVLGPTGTLTNTDQITLKGPGNSGSDSIYFGMEVAEDSANDIWNIRFWGHGGFISTQAADNQPLQSSKVYLLTWNQSITYWIVADGRRWYIAIKVSTVYTTGYCGFMLPYATPSEYPYPMVVAGISNSNVRWSDTTSQSRFMACPAFQSMYCFWPDNVWRDIGNYNNGGTVDYGDSAFSAAGYVFPTRGQTQNGGYGSPDAVQISTRISPCFDGSYFLRELVLGSSSTNGPFNGFLGELDGVYWIPGVANSSENIITINSVSYLTVQNLFRTTQLDYLAMRLQ